MYENQTNGMIVIQKIGNGYIVTLPPKRVNEYARGFMPIAREMHAMQHEDPLISELQGKGEEKKDEGPAYELATVGNVFTFSKWEQVLDFLAQKFDEAEGEKE